MSDSCKFCKLLESPEDNPCWIATFPNSVAFVYEDQFLPGRVIVVFKQHVEEILDLPLQENTALYQETLIVTKAVYEIMEPEKLNIAMLGNKVPHVHWHIIPRLAGGYLEGKAPWPHPTKHLSEDEYKELATQFRNRLN